MVDAERHGDCADLPMLGVIQAANLGVLGGRDHDAATRDGPARVVERPTCSRGNRPCIATDRALRLLVKALANPYALEGWIHTYGENPVPLSTPARAIRTEIVRRFGPSAPPLVVSGTSCGGPSRYTKRPSPNDPCARASGAIEPSPAEMTIPAGPTHFRKHRSQDASGMARVEVQ